MQTAKKYSNRDLFHMIIGFFLKEIVIFVMSMGYYFSNTNPIYFGRLIGACSQIIEHDINYSLRY